MSSGDTPESAAAVAQGTLTEVPLSKGSIEEPAAPPGPAQPPPAEPVRSGPEAVRLPVVPRSNFEIAGEHARGGLGRIMRARDLRLDRVVAIKELLRARSSSARRFLREVKITAKLQHPSIVPVHEAGRWPSGEPFY